MSVAGIGSSLSSLGSQYDFTKLTNAQLYAAAQKLGSEGKISKDDARELSFVAQGIDRLAIDPSKRLTTAQTLADPTQQDWITYFKQSAAWVNSVGGSKGGQITSSILSDLQKYQGTATGQEGSTFSANV